MPVATRSGPRLSIRIRGRGRGGGPASTDTVRHRKRSAVAGTIQPILLRLVEHGARRVGAQATVGYVCIGRRAQQDARFGIGRVGEDLRAAPTGISPACATTRGAECCRKSRAEETSPRRGERRQSCPRQEPGELASLNLSDRFQ